MNSNSVDGKSQDDLGYQLTNLKVFDTPKVKQEFNVNQEVDFKLKFERKVEEKQEYSQGSWSAKIMQRLVQLRYKNYSCQYSYFTFKCLKNQDYKKHLILCHQYH